jgi:DNA-binding GntR family transcriptional regulator
MYLYLCDVRTSFSGQDEARRASTTLTLTVTDELRRRILSAEIPPGTRLRQIHWAEELGVSPTPVREAFTALAKEGLVRHDAQRGVVVFTPTTDDVAENYEIRLALEPLATEIAARNMTEEEMAGIEGVIVRMRACEGPAYQLLNRELHSRIYAAARRPQLVELIESLRDRFEAYVGLDMVARADPQYGTDVRQQHEAIAEALRARAPKRARKLMEVHLNSNRQHIAETVEILRRGRDVTDSNGGPPSRKRHS